MRMILGSINLRTKARLQDVMRSSVHKKKLRQHASERHDAHFDRSSIPKVMIFQQDHIRLKSSNFFHLWRLAKPEPLGLGSRKIETSHRSGRPFSSATFVNIRRDRIEIGTRPDMECPPPSSHPPKKTLQKNLKNYLKIYTFNTAKLFSTSS